AVHAIPPASREIPRVTNARRTNREDVRVEGDDEVRLVEVINGVRRTAGGLLRGGAGAVPRDRIPLMPLRLGKGLLDQPDLLADRRRRHRLGQEADAGALLGLLRIELAADRRQEISPTASLALVEDGLQPVGVVQRQNGGLREDVRAAETRWMLWI